MKFFQLYLLEKQYICVLEISEYVVRASTFTGKPELYKELEVKICDFGNWVRYINTHNTVYRRKIVTATVITSI